MNILLNVRWPIGGIRTYLRYVYRLFPPDRYRFTLLAPSERELDVLKDDLGEQLNSIVVSTPTIGSISVQITKLLRSNRYDLVHSHGLSAGMLAALPMMATKVPHIVTLHDVFLRKLFNGAQGYLKRHAVNRGLQLPEVLHLLGSDQKENLAEFFPNVAQRFDKIEIIRSGIEIERFSAKHDHFESLAFRTENNIPNTASLLGYFGRFMAQKGFGTLVDAIEILLKEKDESEVPIIAAFGSGGFLEREKRMLRSRRLGGQFRFLPFMANIADALPHLDGVVMPSRWEAVGLVAMEVLVAGVPLLASNCIGLREVVAETPAFSYQSDNARDLADVLNQWCANPRKVEFKEFAPQAAKRFDVQKTATGLQELYARIITGSQSDTRV